MRRFAFAFLASLALVASPITSAAPGSPRSGEAPLSGPQADYNGDGFADLAVGIPYETVSGKSTAGAVNVLYGTAGGLTVTGTQLWHQDSPGVRNQVSTGDYFGDPIAPADFNGDGFSDLAIGVPDETVRGKIDPGRSTTQARSMFCTAARPASPPTAPNSGTRTARGSLTRRRTPISSATPSQRGTGGTAPRPI